MSYGLLKRTGWVAAVLALLSGPVTANETGEAEITKRLGAMTLRQKVGQMTQVTLAVMMDKSEKDRVVLEKGAFDRALHHYQVGSILNTGSRALSVDEWHALISDIQDAALKNDGAIPVLYGIDSIHGATYTRGSTLFPHNIGLAAARDPDLVRELAAVTAMETRASGIRWNFDPVLDVGRQPLWSRFPETYGEDPFLVTRLGVASVEGYRGDGLDAPNGVASCMKHYIGYSVPANGKDRTPAYIPAVELWDKHMPPFEAAIAAGADTLMVNSASVNGMPVHGSRELLTGVLRERYGFEGVIVSDWEDVIRLHTRHRVAETPREAVRMAVEAGLDMSMVPNDFSFADHLYDLVESGEIAEARIDESVARILRLKRDLGLFEDAYPEAEAAENFGRESYRELALEAARATLTLLKNEGDVLPLSPQSSVLLAGPAAKNLGPLHGSWSYTWQGADERRYPDTTRNLAEALQAKLGEGRVTVMGEQGYEKPANYDTEELVRLAVDADVIVLALGERAYAESPGALDDLNLDSRQKALVRAAAETGKPVIAVLAQGRPRIINDIEPLMHGILLAYLPASRGADAIADALLGDHNPSGRLPFSYPQFTGDLTLYDRRVLADIQQLTPGKITYNGYKPQWPFGFGLSYTTFEYSNLRVDRQTMGEGDSLKVSVDLRNTGGHDGDHAVDLFISDSYASLSPAVKRLRDFRKVYLRAGEQATVEFQLDAEDLSMVNAALERVVEPGEFRVSIGDQSVAFQYETE